MIIDRLKMVPPILGITDLEPDDLSDPFKLNKWLDKNCVQVWRVLLCHSVQLHDPPPHVAVNTTYY